MRQALHIFGKDVRCLTYEIVATLALVATYVYFSLAGSRAFPTEPFTAIMLPIAAWVLIARSIHAEALPGTQQFWLTRPYSRGSLLTAKVLFLLTFISLPKLVSDSIIIQKYGHSLGPVLPGLLWSQVLLFSAFILPLAALATLTSSMVQLFFSSLLLLPILLFGFGDAFGPMSWIVHAYTAAALALASVVIVAMQYSLRRTAMARLAGVALGLVVVLGAAAIPSSFVEALQARQSKRQIDASQVRVSLDAERQSARPIASRDSATTVSNVDVPYPQIYVPLQITDLPQDADGSDMDARVIGTGLRIEAADGTAWPSGEYPDTRFSNYGQSQMDLNASVPRAFYTRVKDQPVKLHVTAYVTLFGHRRTTLIGSELTPIPGGSVCFIEPPSRGNVRICLGLFRSPPNLILWPERRSGPYETSHSPFPADLGVSPVRIFGFYPGSLLDRLPIALVTLEPLAYIQREFEIDGRPLRDFEQPPPPRTQLIQRP